MLKLNTSMSIESLKNGGFIANSTNIDGFSKHPNICI
jgi:hypothetical protein